MLGCLAMIDDGETDWKVICIATDDVLAPKLNDIDDVERLMPGTISVMREWLRNYKTVDGKPQNAFGMEEKAMNREYTLKVPASAWLACLPLRVPPREPPTRAIPSPCVLVPRSCRRRCCP